MRGVQNQHSGVYLSRAEHPTVTGNRRLRRIMDICSEDDQTRKHLSHSRSICQMEVRHQQVEVVGGKCEESCPSYCMENMNQIQKRKREEKPGRGRI